MSALLRSDDLEVMAQAWAAVQSGEPLIVSKTGPGMDYLKLDGAIFLPGDAVTLTPSERVKWLIETGFLTTPDRAALGAVVLAEKRKRATERDERTAADRAARAGAELRAAVAAADLQHAAARLALRDAKEQHAAAQHALDLASGGDPDRAARLHSMQRSVAHDRQRVLSAEAVVKEAEAAVNAARARLDAAQSL